MVTTSPAREELVRKPVADAVYVVVVAALSTPPFVELGALAYAVAITVG